jgi:hypothetical protein
MIRRVQECFDHPADTRIQNRLPFTDVGRAMSGTTLELLGQVASRNSENRVRVVDQLRDQRRVQPQRLLLAVVARVSCMHQLRGDRALGNPPVHAHHDVRQLALLAQINHVLPRYAKPAGNLTGA